MEHFIEVRPINAAGDPNQPKLINARYIVEARVTTEGESGSSAIEFWDESVMFVQEPYGVIASWLLSGNDE